ASLSSFAVSNEHRGVPSSPRHSTDRAPFVNPNFANQHRFHLEQGHFGTKSKDTAAVQAIGRDECGARAAALKRTYIDGQGLLVSLVAVCFNQQLRRSGLANATTKQPTGHNKLKNNYIAQA